MGFDTDLFEDKVYPEMICPICMGVFDEPLQVIYSSRSCKPSFFICFDSN